MKGAGRGAVSPRRLPEKACTVSPRLPSPVEYRWAAVVTAAGYSRAGGPFLIFYSVRSLLPPRLLGLAAAQWTETCFSLGRPFLGREEDGGASDVRESWRRRRLPVSGSAPLPVALLAPALGCAHPAALRTNPPVEITF